MSIADNIVEFERLYNKAKAYDMILLYDIIVYKIINNTKISDSHEKLVRATMVDLYASMKKKIKKGFS